MKAWYKPYQLTFKAPILTSRGRMDVKNGYYLFVSNGKATGIGECSFIEGLSIDDLSQYEETISALCAGIEKQQADMLPDLTRFPSIAFAYETALLDLHAGGNKVLFNSRFTAGEAGIPINGLIWMGEKDFMLDQVQLKLEQGFHCIKIKVGAIDFDEELRLLAYIRERFSPEQIELRLDANGAFDSSNGLQKLKALAEFGIHSIEQPVKPGQWQLMRSLCDSGVIDIALDEELIGVTDNATARELLIAIKPRYLILKPSLLGGFRRCEVWVKLAAALGTGWWATSALESNIGLNAIAQWAFLRNGNIVHGLGTGSLYTHNVASPLNVRHGALYYDTEKKWDL